jgi:thioredoxin-related protein
MNTVTYSDDTVKELLGRLFVPVRLHVDWQQPFEEMRRYSVKWTPTLLVLDDTGAEHNRVVGFLPPADFMAQLNLGRAKLHFTKDNLSPAINEFTEALETCPACPSAAEARYFLGVSKYKQTHDAQELKKTWEVLSRDFPESEWTKKAEPYSQL